MNNIVYYASFILPLVILYLVMSNMNILNGNKYLYGINVDITLIDKDEIKLINKKFKVLHTIGFLVILTLFILSSSFLDLEIKFSLALITYLIYGSIIYVVLHNKVKAIKKQLLNNNIISENSTSKVFVDIDFLNERDKLLSKFKYLYSIPIIIVFIAGLFTFINKNNLGKVIPIQFDYNGLPSKIIPNTTLNLLGFLFIMLSSVILISFLSINSLKSRLRVNTLDVKKSKVENISFLNKIGYGFLITQISLSLITITSLAIMFNIVVNPIVFKLISLVMIISVVLLCFTFVRSPNAKITSSYSSEDDEKNWILGMLYNNPNDPSFMVPKRFGIGWTINVGTPLGKIFLLATIIIIVISLFSLFKNIF